MPKNIKEIRLWDNTLDGNRKEYNDVKEVKIIFNFPCTWTTLHVEDLEKILRLWIKGEQQKLDGEYKDAYWLRNLINKIFEEECP